MGLLCQSALGLTFLAVSASALQDSLEVLEVEESDPRLFFVNYTSSLVSVNSTLLAYALAGIAIAGAVGLVLYFLSVEPTSSGYGGQYYQSRGFRDEAGGYSGILTLLSVASDIYGRLNYDDIDCQKKIICEFMEKPEIFGSGAVTVKSGVKYAASFLAPMGIPIISQLVDATTATDQDRRTCEKRFAACRDISLRESYKQSAERLAEMTDDLTDTTEEDREGCDSEREDCAIPQEEEVEYEYYYDEK